VRAGRSPNATTTSRHRALLSTRACWWAIGQLRREHASVAGRGRKGDPLYGIRLILRCGAEKLTDKQKARLDRAVLADERHDEVYVAWQCAQQLRAAYKAKNPAEGRRIAEKVLASFPTCPIPEIKRLGRTLKQWRAAFLAYFATGHASNGGTEAINGLIELHRRVARGFRNRHNYRLRMLLIGGGLTSPTSGKKSRTTGLSTSPIFPYRQGTFAFHLTCRTNFREISS
jgi:hypothetical protein